MTRIPIKKLGTDFSPKRQPKFVLKQQSSLFITFFYNKLFLNL